MVVTCALMQTLDLLCLQEDFPTLAKISEVFASFTSPRLVASSEQSRRREWRKRKANESHKIETTLKTLENHSRSRALSNPSEPPASKQTNKQTNTFVSIKKTKNKKSHPIKVIKWISVVLLPTWTPPKKYLQVLQSSLESPFRFRMLLLYVHVWLNAMEQHCLQNTRLVLKLPKPRWDRAAS